MNTTGPAGKSSPPRQVGWGRAAVVTAVVVVGGAALLVYVPNAILTRLTSLDRSTRVALATSEFLAALGSLAAALRLMQRRNLM